MLRFYPLFISRAIKEFADVFCNELPQEAAKISPFNLVVDDLEWKVSKNRAPPRQLSIVKQIALFKTLQTLISRKRKKRRKCKRRKSTYGIFYSCMYLQSLLRVRLITVQTDHRNLLFITEASNPMIVRWYMALSEFSFTLEFIPGIDNNKFL